MRRSSMPGSASGSAAVRPLRRMAGRLQVQLMVRFLSIVLLLAVVVSVLFFCSISAGNLERQAGLLAQQADSHLKLMDSRVDTVESDALSILSNSNIKEYLSYPYTRPAQKVHDALYSFQPLVRWVLTINTQYRRLHFLTASAYTSGDPYVDALKDYLDRDWVQDAMANPGRGCWQNMHQAEAFRYDHQLSEQLASCTLYAGTGNHLIVLDVSPAWLYQDIPFVLDSATGRVLYSAVQPEAVGEIVSLTQEDGIASMTLGGMAYYVHALDNSRVGVTILSCVESAPIRSQTFSQTWIYVGWTAVFILIAMALLSMASSSVVQRMGRISRNVSSITRGDYDVTYQVTKNDEIDDLGADIVSMAEQMNQMVNQRLKQQMLLRESEFRALQQQINPHFIFNIIQTMQMIAEMNDQTDLADMIAQFGRMVRYNLYAATNVPLEEELGNVRDYMALQQVMYNGEMTLEVRMEDMPPTLELPRLLLQPLVENAVTHGRVKGRMLHVCIEGEQAEDGILMRIRNDGKPLDSQRLQQLREVLARAGDPQATMDTDNLKDNLALINIQKRLLIRFGPSCRLRMESGEEQGVEVSFVIPYKEAAP